MFIYYILILYCVFITSTFIMRYFKCHNFNFTEGKIYYQIKGFKFFIFLVKFYLVKRLTLCLLFFIMISIFLNFNFVFLIQSSNYSCF